MPRVMMVTGGGRSGKSSFALGLASPYGRKIFIATAEAFDDEMRERIRKHREERGETFDTLEAPLDLAGAISQAGKNADFILVDCLTVWLGNIMHHESQNPESSPRIESLFAILADPPCDIAVVTNELGLGIIPGDKISRIFRDACGRVNQRLAQISNDVHFVVSGIPLKIKGDS